MADSGLLNKTNVELLRQAGYKYILGARIKKEPAKVIEWILTQEKASGAYYEYARENGERLVLGYSEQRAKKDAHNRDKGIERLRKAYGSGVLTKALFLQNVNNGREGLNIKTARDGHIASAISWTDQCR